MAIKQTTANAAGVLQGHSDPIEKAARAGYVARGTVYLIIGYFSAKAAYTSAQPMGSRDAVGTVFGSVGGIILLVVLVRCWTGTRLLVSA